MIAGLLLIAVAVAFVALDRLTKAVVARRMRPGRALTFGAALQLRHVRHRLNPQVVDRQREWLIALLACTSAFVVWLTIAGAFFTAPLARVGLAIALAGASCNLWDRLRHHAFVDFICVGRWPAFNLADIGICVGVLLALMQLR